MVNGTGEENESTFTMEECLDTWFDTLYYTNYQSDYYDVACYLQLAAKSMGLPEDKVSYLRTLLFDFGLIPDDEYNFTVGYAEDSNYHQGTLAYKTPQVLPYCEDICQTCHLSATHTHQHTLDSYLAYSSDLQ